MKLETATSAFKKTLTSTTSAMVLALAGVTAMTAAPAEAIPFRDDVGDSGAQAFAAGWDGVVQLFYWRQSDGAIFFNCTGSMINARTVITAAHCFNSQPDSTYGFGQSAVPIVAYGEDTFDALFNWIGTGQQFLSDTQGLSFAVDTINHPDGQFGVADFPGADVTLLALQDPLYTLPTYGMLFSPIPTDVFDAGVLVNQIGYGTFHPGSTDVGGINGLRRAGENMLGLMGSQNDFFNALAQNGLYNAPPTSNQSLYWTDFDQPGRTGTCVRGPDPFLLGATNSIVCDDNNGFDGGFIDGDTLILPGPSIDYFPGDALPNEVATAGGDSGGPLMAMNIHDNPLILGVLSGGFVPGFFHASGQTYGEVSYYNPLFNFHQFIAENNPYKYVSAVAGDGNWSDATHWVQTMDPNYFIYNGSGEIVNGLPTGPEPGVAGTGPQEGIVFDTPAETYSTAGGAPQEPLESQKANGFAVADATEAGGGFQTLSGDLAADDSANGLVIGTGATASNTTASITGKAPVQDDVAGVFTDFLATGFVADAGVAEAPAGGWAGQSDSTGTRGAATGPGSTNFVPDNNYGFGAAVAQFFEVTLDANGTTTADLPFVEIDKLNIRGTGATLDILDTSTILSMINVEVFGGTLNVDGLLGTREVVLWGGLLTGSGELDLFETNLLFGNGVSQAGTLFNLNGVVNPGAMGATGTLEVNGNYVQASGGVFMADIDAGGASDNLLIDGDYSLDGALIVNPVAGYLPRYGDSFEIITSTGVGIGSFAAVSDLPGVLRPVVSYGASTVGLTLEADAFSTQADFTNAFQTNIGSELDAARDTDYAALADVFGGLDLMQGNQLLSSLNSLAPWESVLFDRSTRMHDQVLNRALRNQIGEYWGYSGAGDTTMAAAKQATGSTLDQDLSHLAMAASAKEGHGDHDGASRVFGSFGLISGDAETIVGAEQSDLEGDYGLVGFDMPLGHNMRAGAAIGFADTDNTLGAMYGSTMASVETDQYSAFLSYEENRTHASLAVHYSEHSSDSTRIVNVGSSAPSAARYEADGFGIDASWRYDLSPEDRRYRAATVAGLSYNQVDFDGTSTTGAVAGLDIAARDYESLAARFGTAFALNLGGSTELGFYTGAAKEFNDDAELFSAVFSAAPNVGAFAVEEDGRDTIWFEFASSLSAEVGGGVLALNYESTFDRDYADGETVSVSFALPF